MDSAHLTEKLAEKEVLEILELYAGVYEVKALYTSKRNVTNFLVATSRGPCSKGKVSSEYMIQPA